jgi:hypothetical protein
MENKMGIIQKLKTFALLEKGKKIIFFEAYFYLALARILKKIPFSKLAPSLGTHMAETTTIDNPYQRENIRFVSEAIHIMSRYTFWESMCLVKAIAGMKMLQRRQIESTLYLGTTRDKEGKLIAHAWLRSGSFFISGAEEKDKFTVVAKFANEIRKND